MTFYIDKPEWRPENSGTWKGTSNWKTTFLILVKLSYIKFPLFIHFTGIIKTAYQFNKQWAINIFTSRYNLQLRIRSTFEPLSVAWNSETMQSLAAVRYFANDAIFNLANAPVLLIRGCKRCNSAQVYLDSLRDHTY